MGDRAGVFHRCVGAVLSPAPLIASAMPAVALASARRGVASVRHRASLLWGWQVAHALFSALGTTGVAPDASIVTALLGGVRTALEWMAVRHAFRARYPHLSGGDLVEALAASGVAKVRRRHVAPPTRQHSPSPCCCRCFVE